MRVEEAVLFRKRKGAYKQKKDDRDKLLYDVTEVKAASLPPESQAAMPSTTRAHASSPLQSMLTQNCSMLPCASRFMCVCLRR